jgi:hypothetical protein
VIRPGLGTSCTPRDLKELPGLPDPHRVTDPAVLSAAVPRTQGPQDPQERKARQAQARAARAKARAADRAIAPARDATFADLDLAQLRSLRAALVSEEDRVSYWRRLIQARVDVLRAGDRNAVVSPEQLREVLSGERIHGGRTAMVSIVGSDGVPPLPDLAQLWGVVDASPEHEAALLAAEQKLSEYRSSLHGRLDAVGAELIARYHENPLLCLVALPLDLPGG